MSLSLSRCPTLARRTNTCTTDSMECASTTMRAAVASRPKAVPSVPSVTSPPSAVGPAAGGASRRISAPHAPASVLAAARAAALPASPHHLRVTGGKRRRSAAAALPADAAARLTASGAMPPVVVPQQPAAAAMSTAPLLCAQPPPAGAAASASVASNGSGSDRVRTSPPPLRRRLNVDADTLLPAPAPLLPPAAAIPRDGSLPAAAASPRAAVAMPRAAVAMPPAAVEPKPAALPSLVATLQGARAVGSGSFGSVHAAYMTVSRAAPSASAASSAGCAAVAGPALACGEWVAVKEFATDPAEGDHQLASRAREVLVSCMRLEGSAPGMALLQGGGGWADVRLAMPLAAGTLSSVPPGPAPLHAIRVIGRQLLRALATLHAAGVHHRDVKPSNVLVAAWRHGGATGWEPVLQLADFGLANTLPISLDPNCATLWWRSPEALRGQRHGAGVDVWAVGIVLVWMATGAWLLGGSKAPADALQRLEAAIPGCVSAVAAAVAPPTTVPAFVARVYAAATAAVAGEGGASAAAAATRHPALDELVASLLQPAMAMRPPAGTAAGAPFWTAKPSYEELGAAAVWFARWKAACDHPGGRLDHAATSVPPALPPAGDFHVLAWLRQPPQHKQPPHAFPWWLAQPEARFALVSRMAYALRNAPLVTFVQAVLALHQLWLRLPPDAERDAPPVAAAAATGDAVVGSEADQPPPPPSFPVGVLALATCAVWLAHAVAGDGDIGLAVAAEHVAAEDAPVTPAAVVPPLPAGDPPVQPGDADTLSRPAGAPPAPPPLAAAVTARVQGMLWAAVAAVAPAVNEWPEASVAVPLAGVPTVGVRASHPLYAARALAYRGKRADREHVADVVQGMACLLLMPISAHMSASALAAAATAAMSPVEAHSAPDSAAATWRAVLLRLRHPLLLPEAASPDSSSDDDDGLVARMRNAPARVGLSAYC